MRNVVIIVATLSLSPFSVAFAEDDAEEAACVPQTYEEALSCLDEVVPEEYRRTIAAMTYDELISTHRGLGRWVRNNWIYGGRSGLGAAMGEMGFQHPDDMSSTLIDGYWARMNGCTVDLAAYAASYDAYWDQIRRSNEVGGEVNDAEIARPVCPEDETSEADEG